MSIIEPKSQYVVDVQSGVLGASRIKVSPDLIQRYRRIIGLWMEQHLPFWECNRCGSFSMDSSDVYLLNRRLLDEQDSIESDEYELVEFCETLNDELGENHSMSVDELIKFDPGKGPVQLDEEGRWIVAHLEDDLIFIGKWKRVVFQLDRNCVSCSNIIRAAHD